jgi:hypothetical protein
MTKISTGEKRAKKSPLIKAGLKLFSWRRIVETGVIMGLPQICV